MKNLKNIFYTLLFAASSLCGTVNADTVTAHQVGIETNGNIVAVWIDFTMSGMVVQSNVKVGTSWGTPETISSPNDNVDYLQLAVVPNGTDVSAVAIWTEYNEGVNSLYAAMLQSSTLGWTTVALVSDAEEDIILPLLSVSGVGDVVAVWSTQAGDHIRSSRATIPTNTWSTPEIISN